MSDLLVPKKSEYALRFYLSQVIPRGGIVAVLHPKVILARLLPQVAKEKRARVIALGASREAVQQFADAGVLIEGSAAGADVFLCEPELLVDGGVLVSADESELIGKYPAIAVASVAQLSSRDVAHLEFVPLAKVVSEVGVFPSEFLKEEVSRVLPLLRL